MKTCSKCKEDKPLDKFNKDKSRKDGHFPWCRACHKAHTAAWRARHTREEIAERQRKSREKRDANQAARDRYLTNGQIYTLQKRYGIGPKDILLLYESQDGYCDICGRPFGPKYSNRPNVDHDHGTGEVRGLLCTNCNNGLGFFRDSVKYLTEAIRYLEHPPAARLLKGDDK